MPRITVWPDRYVVGWNGEDEDPVTYPVTDALQALNTEYDTYAHFVPYYLEGLDEVPRLNNPSLKALGNIRVLFDLGVADIDDRVAHSEKRESDTVWREEMLSRIESLPFTVAWYQTRAGFRLLWAYDKPLTIEEWKVSNSRYLALLADYGIIADNLPWNQFYGLPFVNRDGKPQKWPAKLSDMPYVAHIKEVPKPAVKGFLTGIKDVKLGFELPAEIPDGERNRTLTKYAAKLRRMGLRYDQILTLITAEDSKRCKPPIGIDSDGLAELERIAQWADEQEGNPIPSARPEARQKRPMLALDLPATARSHDTPTLALPESPDPFVRGSEQELAEWLLSEVINTGVSYPCVYDRGCLWRYCDEHGIWESIFPEIVHNLIGKLDGAFYQKGPDENGNERFGALKVKAQLRVSVSKIMYDESTKREFFDNAANGLTFTNGFVEIKDNTIVLTKQDPNQRSTHCLPYAYETGSMPALWLQTLKEIWQNDEDQADKIQLLREFMGICLMNRAGMYQKALILLGEGSNGKSVIQKIIRALFTGKAIAAVPPQEMSKEYNRAKLADARINIVAEMPDNEILDSAPVKAMISADIPIMARRIYGEPFDFLPMFGNIFDANTLPMFRDMSHGFKRRWLILTFNRRFEESEQDKTRAETIINQELASVAAWALDGARDLLYRGQYGEPMSSIQAVTEWREGSDACFVFLNDCCEKLTVTDTEKLGALPGDLYSAYAAWSRRNGHDRPLTSMHFYKRVSRLGYKPVHTKFGNKYPLKLKKVAKLFS